MYLTYGTPTLGGTARTVQRMDWVCTEADGLDTIVGCADAIFTGISIEGQPPDFANGPTPPDYWWAMDPAWGGVQCLDLAILMQDMSKLLGLGAGKIGYVYPRRKNQNPPDTPYDDEDDKSPKRFCNHGWHRVETLKVRDGLIDPGGAGVFHQWEAVFVLEDKYYGVKIKASVEPGDIMKEMLTNHDAIPGGCDGINCICEGLMKSRIQQWEHSVGGVCSDPVIVQSPWDD